MNRIDRLFAILLILQKHKSKPITALEIGNRFGVTERTIYRDMQALMEMGVPIASSPSEGYRLLDTFHLPPILLSPNEAIALFLGAWMLKRHADGRILIDLDTALHKLEAALPTDTQNQVNQLAHIIDFYPIQNRLNLDEPHLLTILQAIQSKQVIHVVYRAYLNSETTERDIEPYHLTFSEGAWYMNGFCRLRNDMRAFRLNRIVSLTVLDEVFRQRIMIADVPNTIQITVKFNPQLLPHVRERQHYCFIQETDDHLMLYEVHQLSEIQNWLFGFGSQAEIISPPELRQWVIDEAKRLINMLT